jgi:hypothetical protein
MALQEFGTTYSAQIATLKEQLMAAALASGGWGYFYEVDVLDADTFAPIILALSPYYSETTTYLDSTGASKTISETIDACTSASVISAMQSATGAIYSWGSDNIYTTGLVMAALVSVGKDPAIYTKNGRSLVDGLMLYYDAANRYGSSGANDEAFGAWWPMPTTPPAPGSPSTIFPNTPPFRRIPTCRLQTAPYTSASSPPARRLP